MAYKICLVKKLNEKILDAFVVGGAVSGSRTAELIAKEGKDVVLVEDNTEVGCPCKCTGLVSWRIKELLPNLPNEIIVNTVGKAEFFSPSGRRVVLKSKNPVYLLDRPGLDKFLFDSAVKSGAKTRTGERFIGYRKLRNCLKVKTDKNTYKTKILVGADGANSTVGKQAELKYPENYLVGVQTTATGNFNNVELWIGSKFCPKFFAWVVPENNSVARIGLATNPNASKYYEEFLKMRIGRIEKPNVGGIIRFGLMENTSADRIMVVGDAACQVKPYSGGGIIYGLIGSKFAARAALDAIEYRRFDEDFLKESYDEKWKTVLGPAITRGMFLYKMISSKSDLFLNTILQTANLGTKIFNKLDMDLINVFV